MERPVYPWNRAEAQEMRDQGISLAKIAKHFGTTDTTVKCRLDDKYAEYRRRRISNCRKIRENGERPAKFTLVTDRRPPSTDVEARLAEIPPDTRSLTQRLCGDPLPGRSAFDRLYR